MIDLEQEFQLLLRTVYKQIEDKVQSGELTRPEANQLLTMFNVRLAQHLPDEEEDGWSSSTRACMEAYEAERDAPPFDDDGWAPSTRCW